jgi:hypothetical protein
MLIAKCDLSNVSGHIIPKSFAIRAGQDNSADICDFKVYIIWASPFTLHVEVIFVVIWLTCVKEFYVAQQIKV